MSRVRSSRGCSGCGDSAGNNLAAGLPLPARPALSREVKAPSHPVDDSISLTLSNREYPEPRDPPPQQQGRQRRILFGAAAAPGNSGQLYFTAERGLAFHRAKRRMYEHTYTSHERTHIQATYVYSALGIPNYFTCDMILSLKPKVLLHY